MLHETEMLFSGRMNGEAEAQGVWLAGLSREKEGSMGCHNVRKSQAQVPERLTWPTHPGYTKLLSLSLKPWPGSLCRRKRGGKLHVEIRWEQYL